MPAGSHAQTSDRDVPSGMGGHRSSGNMYYAPPQPAPVAAATSPYHATATLQQCPPPGAHYGGEPGGAYYVSKGPAELAVYMPPPAATQVLWIELDAGID
jgi:hypothetical protein